MKEEVKKPPLLKQEPEISPKSVLNFSHPVLVVSIIILVDVSYQAIIASIIPTLPLSPPHSNHYC